MRGADRIDDSLVSLDRLRRAKSQYRPVSSDLSTRSALQTQIAVRSALLTNIEGLHLVLARRFKRRSRHRISATQHRELTNAYLRGSARGPRSR